MWFLPMVEGRPQHHICTFPSMGRETKDVRERRFFNQLTWVLHALLLLTSNYPKYNFIASFSYTGARESSFSLPTTSIAKTSRDSITYMKKDGIDRKAVISLCHMSLLFTRE